MQMSARTNPFYIYAPPGIISGNEIAAQMHVLCSMLNQCGHQAYIAAADGVNGHLWTPMLTNQVMAAHYIAGKKPISIAVNNRIGRQPFPGLNVGYESEFEFLDKTWGNSGKLKFYPDVKNGQKLTSSSSEISISLPWVDTQIFSPPTDGFNRTGELVWSGSIIKLGKSVRTEHSNLTDLSPFASTPMSAQARASALRRAECIYCYGTGSITTEARLCGCKVIYIPTDWQLHSIPTHPIATLNTFFENKSTFADSTGENRSFAEVYSHSIDGAGGSVKEFAEISQRFVDNLSFEDAWSDADITSLGELISASPAEGASRSDRCMFKSLTDAYTGWKAKTSPREIYADIAAQYISSGAVPMPTVHVFALGHSMDDLANLLDDLATSWLQPSNICIHADQPCPVHPSELGPQVAWHEGPAEFSRIRSGVGKPASDWCVLIDGGTRLEPFSLFELLKATRSSGSAWVVYAADDVRQANGADIPNLKGGGNVELLRHTNYLGGVMAVKEAAWALLPDRHLYSAGYRLALEATVQLGAKGLLYVDKVISHQPSHEYAGAENAEFNAARDVLSTHWPGSKVVPDEIAGCWKVVYPAPAARVTAVVPTGKQLGYLDALLTSIDRLEKTGIAETILVTAPEDHLKTTEWVSSKFAHLNIQCVVCPTESFNLGASLNSAIAVASHPLILVCDDDVEFLARQTTEALAQYFADPQVSMVSPRQVLQIGQKPLLTGGPCVVGNEACLLPYNGQQQWLAERGFFNRLQMAQDVAGVQGSCYMLRKADWERAGGFNETDISTFFTVTDLGYKLLQGERRIIWTPDASFHHAGAATLRSLRKSPDSSLQLQKQWNSERSALSKKWLSFATSIDLYSQHLSREVPYSLEPSMVIEWDVRSKDRPRVLAQPLSSGSGQYRVIEPLDAMQSANLAETALIFPDATKKRRIISATDIAVTKPDRVLLQHSISDEDISNLRNIRHLLPHTFVIQLMDDLTSDLPTSHPNFNFGMREGHVRTIEAISLCDRLIVSTQPLADYYSSYCDDIVVVPNALEEKMWGHYFKPLQERSRLRVGWAGAAQHQGDLAIVAEVLEHFSKDVDWIFMGMCPDNLRPMIKEFHSFVSYTDYPAKLATLDLDIAIAPLEDNAFNRCKSNLRLLEYGAMGWPVVCSDVYPFRTSDPPVLRCANKPAEWISSISLLVSSFNLRKEMGQKLNKWLHKNYMLSDVAKQWDSAIFK